MPFRCQMYCGSETSWYASIELCSTIPFTALMVCIIGCDERVLLGGFHEPAHTAIHAAGRDARSHGGPTRRQSREITYNIHTYIHSRIHAYKHTQTHAYTQTHTSTHTHTHIYILTHTHTHIIYTHTYAHIHTRTHTLTISRHMTHE